MVKNDDLFTKKANKQSVADNNTSALDTVSINNIHINRKRYSLFSPKARIMPLSLFATLTILTQVLLALLFFIVFEESFTQGKENISHAFTKK